jgi:flagellar basal-body rod protein FlgC
MDVALKNAVSGLNASQLRLYASASNIAGVSASGRLPTSEEPRANAYAPVDVINQSQTSSVNGMGVRSEIIPREPAYNPGYDPSSPQANQSGFVAVPNVDLATELVNTKLAEAVYKANSAIIKVSDQMQKRLLDATV